MHGPSSAGGKGSRAADTSVGTSEGAEQYRFSRDEIPIIEMTVVLYISVADYAMDFIRRGFYSVLVVSFALSCCTVSGCRCANGCTA